MVATLAVLFFDGPKTGVYTDPQQPTASTPPSYSHHKLTCFEYADGKNIASSVNGTDGNALTVTDLDLYYQKVAKAFADIPDTTSVLSADELQARVEENRIVGPNTSGPISISSLVTDYVSSNVFTTTAEVTTATAHGFSVGTPVLIEGVTGTDASDLMALSLSVRFHLLQPSGMLSKMLVVVLHLVIRLPQVQLLKLRLIT